MNVNITIYRIAVRTDYVSSSNTTFRCLAIRLGDDMQAGSSLTPHFTTALHRSVNLNLIPKKVFCHHNESGRSSATNQCPHRCGRYTLKSGTHTCFMSPCRPATGTFCFSTDRCLGGGRGIGGEILVLRDIPNFR